MMCNRPTHYNVIASRDCRTAARKHYTTARRSREKAPSHRCSTAKRPFTQWTSLISSSPPRRLDAAVRPGSCYTCSLSLTTERSPERSPLFMKSTCYLPVSCELQRYASLPFTVCKCIQPVSAKPAGLDAAAARAPVLEKCKRSPVLKTGTG